MFMMVRGEKILIEGQESRKGSTCSARVETPHLGSGSTEITTHCAGLFLTPLGRIFNTPIFLHFLQN
jgi:hypothetical protein